MNVFSHIYGLRTIAVGIELIVNIHIHKMRMNEARSYRSASDKTVCKNLFYEYRKTKAYNLRCSHC